MADLGLASGKTGNIYHHSLPIRVLLHLHAHFPFLVSVKLGQYQKLWKGCCEVLRTTNLQKRACSFSPKENGCDILIYLLSSISCFIFHNLWLIEKYTP
jgi:hypothetical protein